MNDFKKINTNFREKKRDDKGLSARLSALVNRLAYRTLKAKVTSADKY